MAHLAQVLFHLICVKHYSPPRDHEARYFQRSLSESAEFFRRFEGRVDFRGKQVLDVGCGYGATCIYLALNGAKRTIGIDIEPSRIAFAQAKLASDYPQVAGAVEFTWVQGLQDLGDERFDLILSQNSFEHIANPEAFVSEVQSLLAPGGLLAIGFGPLWKSPYGGHISFMTRFPWVHLLFPEAVIMQERGRFGPSDGAETFEQVTGGLNKMTLRRFTSIMQASGLECLYFRTNVSRRKVAALARLLSNLPLCKEYFTFNVYGVWRARQ